MGDSTGQSSAGYSGGGAGLGGAIFAKKGSLILKNVTFSGNSANGGTGTATGQGRGGAIFVCTSDLDNDNTAKGANGGCSASIDEAQSCEVIFDKAEGENTASTSEPKLFWTGAHNDLHDISGITDSCITGTPTMGVTGNSISIASNDTTPDSADDTDWGNVTVGNNASHTFTIQNTGNAALNLTGTPSLVALNGADCTPFSVTTQPTTPVAATTGSTTFQIQYAPTSAVSSTCTVSIANNGATSNPYTFAIAGTGTKVVTSTSVSSALNPSTYGQNVTFTATVNPSAATGTVNFKEGGTSLPGCDSKPLSSGSASCTATDLSAGNHTITADYSGDSTHATSNGALPSDQIVNKADQTIGMNPLGSGTVGGSMSLSATGGNSGNPVTFASQTPSFCTVSGSTVNFIAAGVCTIRASQAGNANYNAATDLDQDISVNAATTTTLLNSALNPSQFSQSVTFSATISGQNPSGTVGFTSDGNAIASCSAVALTGSGNDKTASCTTTALSGGSHTITATYSGDANNQTSNDGLQQTVQNVFTGTGGITARFSGGGNACNLTQAAFVSPPATLPPGYTFPYNLLRFALDGCDSSTATVQITYPTTLPSNAKYWKYGKTASNTTPHWYELTSAVFASDTVTFTLTDGTLGDDDLSANGTITDDGGAGIPGGNSATATAIPTLSEWGLLLMSSLLGLFGAWRGRKVWIR